ncbi:MAG: TIGR04282 family arsenosugar biosynthesis glycosyltransferase [Acidobacteriota bacterium]|nr:TIGR04282 family arsenosugar biosynthesis glycosyltransferase [Acidobacteriota bacterium]
MCKAPAAGLVKTRLVPFLSAENAAQLAACFAADAVRKVQSVCENTIIAFDGDKKLLETILPQNLIWLPQTGPYLGERMHNAFRFAFEKGFSPFVVIGTDSPTLPPEFIRAAIEILQEKRTDAALGEAEDGGFYLLGLNQPDKQIFQDVRWSLPETYLQTVRNIKQSNLHLTTLPIWYDVDTPEDLRRLKTEIENNARARQLAPETALWLERHRHFF